MCRVNSLELSRRWRLGKGLLQIGVQLRANPTRCIWPNRFVVPCENAHDPGRGTLWAYRAISEQITVVMRTEPKDPNLAGWGQFLEPNSTVFQIGPYGTAAGIAVNQIAYPDATVDDRVCAQLRAFWGEKPEGKLFPRTYASPSRCSGSVRRPNRSWRPCGTRSQLSCETGSTPTARGATPVTPSGGRTDVTAGLYGPQTRRGLRSAAERRAKWLANKVEGSGESSCYR